VQWFDSRLHSRWFEKAKTTFFPTVKKVSHSKQQQVGKQETSEKQFEVESL